MAVEAAGQTATVVSVVTAVTVVSVVTAATVVTAMKGHLATGETAATDPKEVAVGVGEAPYLT